MVFLLQERGQEYHISFVQMTSFLFCKATATECHNVCDLLRIYEDGSGQQINMDK